MRTNEIKSYRYIVKHIDNVIEFLDYNDKEIIQKEVIERKRGNWYLGTMSESTYDRHKKRAYENFIRLLER